MLEIRRHDMMRPRLGSSRLFRKVNTWPAALNLFGVDRRFSGTIAGPLDCRNDMLRGGFARLKWNFCFVRTISVIRFALKKYSRPPIYMYSFSLVSFWVFFFIYRHILNLLRKNIKKKLSLITVLLNTKLPMNTQRSLQNVKEFIISRDDDENDFEPVK